MAGLRFHVDGTSAGTYKYKFGWSGEITNRNDLTGLITGALCHVLVESLSPAAKLEALQELADIYIYYQSRFTPTQAPALSSTTTVSVVSTSERPTFPPEQE